MRRFQPAAQICRSPHLSRRRLGRLRDFMSTPQKYTGTAYNGPFVLSRGNDPRTGPTVTYRWRGRQTELEIIEAQQIALGYRTQISIPGDGQGPCTLDVTTGAESTPEQNHDIPLTDGWSLDKNLVEKDVWTESKIAKVLKAALPSTVRSLKDGETIRRGIARLKRDIELYVKGEDKTEDKTGNQIKLTAVVIGKHLEDLFLLNHADTVAAYIDARLRGFDADPQFSWVLKRTTVISRKSSNALRPNKENVLRMFSGPSLQTIEGLRDGEIIGLLPKGYWLKTPAIIERSGIDKWTVTQEYWHAEQYEFYKYGKAI